MNWISLASAQSTPSVDVEVKNEAQEVAPKTAEPTNESQNMETTATSGQQEAPKQPESKTQVSTSVSEDEGKAAPDTTSTENPEEPLEPLDVHVDDTQNDLDSDILETRTQKSGSKGEKAPSKEVMDTSVGDRAPETSTVAAPTGNQDKSSPDPGDTTKATEADSTLSSTTTTATANTTTTTATKPGEKPDDSKSKRSVGFVWYIVYSFPFPSREMACLVRLEMNLFFSYIIEWWLG